MPTMSDKSHVSMEQHVCIVCCKTFDTGSLLLDRRLRASMERYTTTGWGLCPEHQQRFDEGFVALIEIDPQRSGSASSSGRLKPEEAYRTGRFAHLRRSVFTDMFNTQIEDERPCVFVDPEVINHLQAMVKPEEG